MYGFEQDAGDPAHPPQGRLSGKSPQFRIAITIALSAGLYLLISFLSATVLTAAYGLSTGDILKDVDAFLANHGNLNPYRYMQMLSTLGVFGLSALVMSRLITGSWLGYFHFSKKASLATIAYVPLIIILLFPAIALMHEYVSALPVPAEFSDLEEKLERFTLALLRDPSWGKFLLNFLMIAILPAVCEELLFRGVLMRQFHKATGSYHLAILLSGVLFGLIHGQVFKFLPIAVLGILFGYLYWWTRNLWFPIAAHFFNNGIQVVLYFLAARGVIQVDLEAAELLPPATTALLTALFVGVVFLFYTRNRETANERF